MRRSDSFAPLRDVKCWACGTCSSTPLDAPAWPCPSCFATVELRRPPGSVPLPTARQRLSNALLPPAVAALVVVDAAVGVLFVLPELARSASLASRALHAAAAAAAFVVLGHFSAARVAHARYRHPAAPRGWSRSGGGGSRSLRYCTRCSVVQLLSSHHCSRCGVCVPDRSHHCPYIGVCVGAATLRPFLLFLAAAAFGSCFAVLASLAAAHAGRRDVLAAAWAFHEEHPMPSEVLSKGHGMQVLLSLMHLARGAWSCLVGARAPRWVIPIGLLVPVDAAACALTSSLLYRSIRVTASDAADAAARAGRPPSEAASGAAGSAVRDMRRHVFGRDGAHSWAAVAAELVIPWAHPPRGSGAEAALGLDARQHDS